MTGVSSSLIAFVGVDKERNFRGSAESEPTQPARAIHYPSDHDGGHDAWLEALAVNQPLDNVGSTVINYHPSYDINK